MNTIVVATDFSEHADVACRSARALASRFGAELLFVHAVFMDEARPNAYELSKGHVEAFRRMVQEDIVHRRESLSRLVEDATQAGIRARYELVDDAPVQAICRIAETENASLIVMGSHGRTGLGRILLGSVAERVVRHSHTNILVARFSDDDKGDDNGYGRILVPTDFGTCARSAFDHALTLSAETGAIDLLHCWHVESIVDGSIEPAPATPLYAETVGALARLADERGQDWLDSAAESGRSLAFHRREGRPANAIQAFIHEHGHGHYDLVAVGTHGRHGLERVLLGSVAEATVRYSPCSVFIARAST